MKILVCTCFALMSVFGFSAETVRFEHKPLTAGKASLTEKGFVVTRTSASGKPPILSAIPMAGMGWRIV